MSRLIYSVPVEGDKKAALLEHALRNSWEVRQNSAVPKATYRSRPATYVPIAPAPGAEIIRCWFNVRDVVEKHGGAAVFGWSIWKLNNGFHQAIHHAVWEQPDGTLIDVTPCELDVPAVLFMADSRVPFDYEHYRAPASFVMDSKSTEGQVLYTWVDLLRRPLPEYALLRMPKE